MSTYVKICHLNRTKPIHRCRQVAIHWLPLHHSNWHELRVYPEEKVSRVGVAGQDLGWQDLRMGEQPS